MMVKAFDKCRLDSILCMCLLSICSVSKRRAFNMVQHDRSTI